MNLVQRLAEASAFCDMPGFIEVFDTARNCVIAAEKLESAVADFLDADAAWNNDELDEAELSASQDRMKTAMYALREARAA